MKRAGWASAAIALLLALAWYFWPSAPPAGPEAVTPAPSASEAPSRRPSAPERPDNLAPLPSEAASTSSTAERVVFGIVRDPAGAPIQGVSVRILPKRGVEALVVQTQSEGQYVILAVPHTVASLEFSAVGYEPLSFASPAFPTSTRVRWDATLTPVHGVFGVVLSQGTKVAGAEVMLRRAGVHARALARTRSDGEGRFALQNTPNEAGLEVAAWHGQYGFGSTPISGQGAVTIELPGGGTIEGTVRDTEGHAITSFTVGSNTMEALAVDDDEGHYRLGPLAQGPQRIFVAAPGYRPGESKSIELAVGQTVSGIDFVLARSAELRGKVTDAVTRKPIAGAEISPWEVGSDELALSVAAYSGDDGRYVLRSLPGKRTTIRAAAKGYRTLMHGGVNGAATRPVTLDFALTPEGPHEAPKNELIGIGAQLSKSGNGVVINGVMSGGAAEGHLKEGDVIVMVNDLKVASADLSDVVQAIRGEIGSGVVLWVLRQGQGDPTRITLQRGRVSFPAGP